MTSGFDIESFWPLIRSRRIDSTPVCAHDVVAPPPASGPADRDHPRKRIVASPLTPDVIEFARRFGVELFMAYAMSEISAPIVSPPNPTKVGSCGRLRAPVEERVVDAHDVEVTPGETGERIRRRATTIW